VTKQQGLPNIPGYLTPTLQSLQLLHNFTIESQVQFHAPLAFDPTHITHSNDSARGLTHEDLTVFVNSAEWSLCQYRIIHYVQGSKINQFNSLERVKRSSPSLHPFRPIHSPPTTIPSRL
jgi:hypothetical protein